MYVHGREYYAFVRKGDSWEARPVKCGPNNDEFFVIEDGLQEGEQVAMSPRLFVDQVRLPELPPERKQQTAAFGPRRLPQDAIATAEKEPASDSEAPTTAEPQGETAGGE
jgi:hypothetical protein